MRESATEVSRYGRDRFDSPFQLVLREEHEEEHGEGVALGHAGHGDEGSGHPARLGAEVARLPHVNGVGRVCVSGRNLKQSRNKRIG